MPSRLVRFDFKVEGVPTNATTVVLSDPTAAFGVKKNSDSSVIVADGTAMTNSATGVYEYTFTDVVGVAYTAYIEVVYGGATYRFEQDLAARVATDSMVASYDSLLEDIGEELFGITTGFSADQTSKIVRCINDGLKRVYSAHAWSFFKPIKDITTTAPYATGTVTIASGVVTGVGTTFPSDWAADGILKVSDSYYSVASYDSATQLTLDDTSVTVASAASFELARPEIPLAATFEAVANDSDLTYYADQNELYPAVRQRHDQQIRTRQMDDPYFDRPVFYSIRTVEFDPTVGSRKRLALYPTPDAAYVLRVPMILRPTMIDTTNKYPVGGETLSPLITAACVAAAERNYDEKLGGHEDLYRELLPLAIAADLEKSSPTSLGPDMPRGEGYHSGVYDSEYWARSVRMGALTLDTDSL